MRAQRLHGDAPERLMCGVRGSAPETSQAAALGHRETMTDGCGLTNRGDANGAAMPAGARARKGSRPFVRG